MKQLFILFDLFAEFTLRNVTVALVATVTAPPAQAVNVSAEQPATTTRFAVFEPHWGDDDRKNQAFSAKPRFLPLNHPNIAQIYNWAPAKKPQSPSSEGINTTVEPFRAIHSNQLASDTL